MQNISQRYTHWFNKRHHRVGHLFQGRYKAILVDKNAYLLELIRYIHLNPVRAEIVKDLMDYPLSSHSAYAGYTQPPFWLNIDWGLRQFGRTESIARASYLHFIGQATRKELLEQLRHGSNKEGRILVDENFIKDMLKQNYETILAEITIEQLVDVVAHVYQVSSMEITSASRVRYLSEARTMTALMGMDYCDYLLSDFAHYFNRDLPTISKQVQAMRTHLIKSTNSSALLEKMERIKNQITTIRKA